MQTPDRLRFVYIKTYGCQMNSYDSQRIEESLKPLGFSPVDDPKQADVIILNTCHIRAKAEDKLFSELGRMHLIKKQRGSERPTLIVVAGCVGQAVGHGILKRAPYVDAVVGPQTYHTLPETLTKLFWEKDPTPFLALGFPKMEKFDELPNQRTIKGPSVFLSIQEGCNKFCRYCVVPYTRGPEYSRPVRDILEEARRLVDAGAREITLLGQNVNAYHGKHSDGSTWSLGKLIYQLAEIEGLYRIRYTTSHPRDVDQTLLEAHRDVPALMPLLHLPVQSGSDKILAHMNRQYTADFYLKTIEQFLTYNPTMVFSSDFIVGYPGETEEDFQATYNLVEQVKFAQAYSFTYSPRPGTPAAAMEQIPEATKSERLQRLQLLLNQQRDSFHQQFVGQETEVLIESFNNKRWVGRTPFSHLVHITSPSAAIGNLQSVIIERGSANALFARDAA